MAPTILSSGHLYKYRIVLFDEYYRKKIPEQFILNSYTKILNAVNFQSMSIIILEYPYIKIMGPNLRHEKKIVPNDERVK